MASFCRQLKFWQFSNKDVKKQEEIFSAIKSTEESLHESPEEMYECTMKNYGGDFDVTELIDSPEGTLLDRMKNRLQGCVCWDIQWHKLTILLTFIGLCSHIFDYVKDIGE